MKGSDNRIIFHIVIYIKPMSRDIRRQEPTQIDTTVRNRPKLS